jgi:hypothetical protein
MIVASTSVVNNQKRLSPFLEGCEICSGLLAALGDNLEGHFLSFDQIANASAFQRRDVNEYVRASIVRLNEAEAFLPVEKFYLTGSH